MAGEVTMKDLQSLQGYCNKKVAELQTQIDKLNKSIEAFRTAINVQADQLAKVQSEHAKVLTNHAKAINDLGSRGG